MSQLTISLLGTPQIELDGRPIHVETRKAIALLAYLACASRPVKRDELASLLWPGSDQARGVLRRTLAALNQAIGKEWLAADRQTIGLDWEQAGLWVDLVHFQRNLMVAGRLATEQRLGLWAETAGLYRGRFLQGFTLGDSPAYDNWQLWQAEQIARQINQLYERLVQGYQEQGAAEMAIRYARCWLVLEPLREPAQRELIRLLAAAGERAAALQQYQSYLRLLAEEVGVAAQAETVELLNDIQAEPMTAGPSRERLRLAHLPQPLTPFVGREAELAAIESLLAGPAGRLVVLHGPAGVGKSRLALAAAGRWPVGLFWIALPQPLTAESLLATLLAAFQPAIADQPKWLVWQLLCRHLGDQRLLLVLDNFTPFPGDIGRIEQLLACAPALRLLITMRPQPQWPTGRAYQVNGFPCPTAGAIGQSGLAQLFLQQARQVQPGYTLAANDEALLARLCCLVDGKPASIEQAGFWLRLLSLAEIVEQVGKDSNFLNRTF